VAKTARRSAMRRSRTRKFRIIIKRALATAATLPILLFPSAVSALSAGTDKTVNCDNNAVMFCGALSSDNLIHKYDNGDGQNSAQSIHDIFGASRFGITSTDIHAMDTTAMPGTVTKDGTVKVNADVQQNGQTEFHSGDVVATGAITAGRLNMAGSTKVTNGSTTFYVRTPNISFTKDSLDAFVVMKNGVFQFAILSSCGNPVVAKPVQPKPAPKPQVAAPMCTNFDIAPTGDTRTIRVTAFSFAANGATFQSAVIDWGDQTAKTTVTDSNQVIGQMHQFAQDGSFEVGVAINFMQQNGQQVQTPAAAACERKIEFKAAQPQIVTVAQVTPVQPTALPSTGAGSVLALFAGVTVAGSAGYYWFLRRRMD